MAYSPKDLTDGVTHINKDLLQPMQDAIVEAEEKLSTAIYAVLTAEAMDDILDNATDENVGVSYMYLGETTESYKKGAVYTVVVKEV